MAQDIAGTTGNTVLPPGQRWPVTVVVMASMVMVVLDTTIANVALPHMQAALGATSESVAWVLTSYIVATAVAIPITGWLSNQIGRRMLFMIAVAGFTASSALCGAAQSLTMMIGSRVLQGIFGAFLGPLSQATMYDINPPEKHAQAMMIWGMAVMLAPVMGPVVGGWLTESYDWRWVFYINLPIGIVTTVAMSVLLPDWRGPRQRFDFVGFGLLATGLAAFQLMLDRGTQLDWFESTEIWIEAGLTMSTLWMLVIHLVGGRDPIVPKAIFADRNFLAALIFVTLLGMVMMAGGALMAPMLQRLMGYPVLEAGITMVPRGAGTMLGFLVAGRLIHRVDARLLVVAGLGAMAVSLRMMTGFTLDMGKGPVVVSGFLQGIGIGFVMMPMTLLAFATLPATLRTEAASFYNLLRNMGGSVAIAVASAYLASNMQISHAELGQRLSAPMLQTGLAESIGFDSTRLMSFIDAEVNRQSAMIAYLDDFWLMMWMTILCAPLVILMQRPRIVSGPVHIGE